MPDLVTHVFFSERVAASLPEVQSAPLSRDVYTSTSSGPDSWFAIGFYGGEKKDLSKRAGIMHENHTGAFLTALAKKAKTSADRDNMYSYLAGYVCHYALDQIAHPYIFYRTGKYDGTEATRVLRGDHTRLERAIDFYYIRHKYHMTPGRFPLAKKCIPLLKIPEGIRDDLSDVYKEIFGWENAVEDLELSLRDYHVLFALLSEPTGIIDRIARLVDDGKSAFDFSTLSYYRRDLDSDKTDYLNLNHALWKNPADPAWESRESFPELMEKARKKAVEMIGIIYDYVYSDLISDEQLKSSLGNASYTTGLDCTDIRNTGAFVCESLFKKML